MDEEEHDTLENIESEVEGSKAQLKKLSERTRNIERQVESISSSVEKNEDDIDNLQDDVKRNSTVINAVTVGLSGVVIWISDKLTRLSFI